MKSLSPIPYAVYAWTYKCVLANLRSCCLYIIIILSLKQQPVQLRDLETASKTSLAARLSGLLLWFEWWLGVVVWIVEWRRLSCWCRYVVRTQSSQSSAPATFTWSRNTVILDRLHCDNLFLNWTLCFRACFMIDLRLLVSSKNHLAENDWGGFTVTEFRGSRGMEEGKGERYLASGRQYGNALLGVRHQEEEVCLCPSV